MSDRRQFRHLERLRVRWAEIDAQKIVFNAHYLMYLDTAMAGYWRALAMPYDDTMHRLGGELFVRKAGLEYHGSARYDDLLDVGLRCARIGRSSIVFEGGVFRGDHLLVGGELVYVFADPQATRSMPVPPELQAALRAFEAGESMTTMALGSWQQLADAAGALRTAVFVQEQQVPASLERDAADHEALHALLRNRLGQALATGRLLPPVEGVSRIGRMAVHRQMRGSRLGRQVLDALVEAARRRGDHAVQLSAQATAERFYLGAGFERAGEPYEEAGLAHVPMRRSL